MKQTIRLTEQNLHNLIREAINELDWKTYANAAMKSKQTADSFFDDAVNNPSDYQNYYDYNKHSDRARMFDVAASKALDKEFGGNHSVNTNNPRQEFTNTDYNSEFPWRRDVATRPFKGHEEEWPPYSYSGNNFNGSKEISDFVNGDYEYQKGKGWVNKNDKLDEVITRAIRKVLS